MASADWIDLCIVKQYLRYPNPSQPSSDDVALQWFIDAAEDTVRFHCGDILPQTYSERHDGGDYRIFLWNTPIISIKNIEEGWGYVNFELDFQDANTDPSVTTMWGYSIDNAEAGVISRRSVASVPIPFVPGEANIFVQYVAGREKIPGDVRLAALQLIGHWWRNEELRAASMSSVNVQYDVVSGMTYSREPQSESMSYAVPVNIIETLRAHRKMPIIG